MRAYAIAQMTRRPPLRGLGAAPALEQTTRTHERILGLRADHFFKVAMPFLGGILSAFGAVLAYRRGGEQWAILLVASAGITAAFTQSAMALQQVVDEQELPR